MKVAISLVLLCMVNVVYAQIAESKTSFTDSVKRQLLLQDTFPIKKELSGIVVKGKKVPVGFKLDRQVFNASNFLNAANGNAVDILKNIPSVSVNGQGDINVRGSSSFQVMIDGRPSFGDPALVLSQLPAASIESIEIISVPGAVMDADGKSGAINIITKNAPQGGWVVQSGLMIGAPPIQGFDNTRNTHPARGGADIVLAYRIKKLDIGAGANFLRNDMAGYREGDVFTQNVMGKTSFPSEGERSFRRYNYGGRLSAGYQFNVNHRIDAAFFSGYRYQSRVADLDYRVTRLGGLGAAWSYGFFNENTAEKKGIFTLASVGTSHQLDKTSKLQLSAVYEGAQLSSLTTNFNYEGRRKNILYQQTLNPAANPIDIYRLKADVTHQLGKKSIQWGYQFRYDQQRGDFSYRFSDGNSGMLQSDPRFTSRLNMQNNIHAGYLQFGVASNRWNVQYGIRAEHMLRRLDFQSDDLDQQLPLLNLFPSYLIKYNFNERSALKQAYSRRIKRTNNFELNPFPEREHTETLEKGDPGLLPELTGIWELAFEQKIRNGSFYFSLYHQRIKNPIQRVNSVFNDTILNRIFTNAGLASQSGLEANLVYRVGSIWQMALGGNAYHYQIRGAIFDRSVPIQNNSWVFSFTNSHTFSLKRDWMMQFNVNYLSLRATAQGEDGAFFTPSLSVKKTTRDKRWGFQFQWLYMDGGMGISNRQRITTRGADFYSTTHYIYEPDQLQISTSFNITKRNRNINLPQSEMADKEF